MGLTKSSVGTGAVDNGLDIRKRSGDEKVIALAGNPNVGKSTVFNALTGMHQHTGNWPGKTVSSAWGFCEKGRYPYILVDIPGTYSLAAHSAEEEVARDFVCFGGEDAVVVVCDATCLERNLNLAVQITEITDKVVVCVNLMDEAKRKGITVDTELLSQRLGVPVAGVAARKEKTLTALLDALDGVMGGKVAASPEKVEYPAEIERAAAMIGESLNCKDEREKRWISLRLLEDDGEFAAHLLETAGGVDTGNAVIRARKKLREEGIDGDRLRDFIVGAIVRRTEKVCAGAVTYRTKNYGAADRKLDKALTGRLIGYPIMLLLLAFIFWLTISGANYPSELLSKGLFWLGGRLMLLLKSAGVPWWLREALITGVYKCVAWVVSVMLPPMAIFFPLFTLLEDVGYLPRIAYNLDAPFKKCGACGKQALTMSMGFGCNAAGIVGCRIIDSPRERLLAILTNNFVPCNGRFPALITIITVFFAGGSSLKGTLILTGAVLISVGMTFAVTKILSGTLLRGENSSFTLELPPYRLPQVGKVIVRSIFDRTLFVLGRAVKGAIPAGLLIWLLANISVEGMSLLALCAGALEPIGKIMGLDGMIIAAFILGTPANEIVIPIMLMGYLTGGGLVELTGAAQIQAVFTANGWTWGTAISTIGFFLMHWPCATTLMTVKKETRSTKWTLLAAGIPTAAGVMICSLFTAVIRLIS